MPRTTDEPAHPSTDLPTIDPNAFKNMMAAVAQEVTVVTAMSDGVPIGLTVSAFTSVSVEPPIVLVCIDKVVSSVGAMRSAVGYTVNFLPERAADVAMIFATHGVDRFGSVAWQDPPLAVGGPVLDIAYGYFECRTVDRIEMGDHWVIFAEVLDGGRRDRDAPPLVWLERGFARIDRT